MARLKVSLLLLVISCFLSFAIECSGFPFGIFKGLGKAASTASHGTEAASIAARGVEATSSAAHGLEATSVAIKSSSGIHIGEATNETTKLKEALKQFESKHKANKGNIMSTESAVLAKDSSLAAILPPGRISLLQATTKSFRAFPTVIYASTDAKRFGKDFMRGAKLGERSLKALRSARPALVKPWLNAPISKRVFIIGASADLPEIKLLKKSLEQEGFVTFFYKYCQDYLPKLCSSEEVGAFFSTSGHAISVSSPSVGNSQYIPVEIAAVNSMTSGGKLIIFSPTDIYQIGMKGSGIIPIQQVIFASTVSQRHKK